MRGRKPDPAEVKDAKGNPGKRKITRTPDAVPGLPVDAPKHLPAKAKKVWAALAPQLRQLKFLRATDQEAFTRYCAHLAEYWSLSVDLKKEGTTYETESRHGRMHRINPKFLVRERLENRLEALEDRFGLNPRARQQILQQMASQAGLPIDTPQQPGSDAPAAPSPSPVGLLGGQSLH